MKTLNKALLILYIASVFFAVSAILGMMAGLIWSAAIPCILGFVVMWICVRNVQNMKDEEKEKERNAIK